MVPWKLLSVDSARLCASRWESAPFFGGGSASTRPRIFDQAQCLYQAQYLYPAPYLVYGLAVPGALSSAESGMGNVMNRHER